MVYILTKQRFADDEEWAAGAFQRYREYLASVQAKLPPGAIALAESDWYFNSRDHRCPHDAWLEKVEVTEQGTGNRLQNRDVAIAIRLLGAYQDGHIEFHYRGVQRYRLELAPPLVAEGWHRDWRFDEFRLGTNGGMVHEIEWWGSETTGTWLIEAADFQYHWIPFPSEARQER